MVEFYDPRLATYLLETTAGSREFLSSPGSSAYRPNRDFGRSSESVKRDPNSLGFLDRADAWLRKRESRRTQLMQKESQSHRRECVFAPTITAKARRLQTREDNRPTSPHMSGDASERLAADAVRKKNKLEAMRAEADERRVFKELEECTFRPRINSDANPPALARVDRFFDERATHSRPRARSKSAEGSRPPVRPQSDVPKSPALRRQAPPQTAESAGESFASRLALYERRRVEKLSKAKQEAAKLFTLRPNLSEESRRIAADARPFDERVEMSMRKKQEHLEAMRDKLLIERGVFRDALPPKSFASAFHDGFLSRHPQNKHQLFLVREEVEAEVTKELTFKPKINPTSVRSRIKELTDADDYAAKIKTLQLERERMAEEIRARRLEEELEECTFQPSRSPTRRKHNNSN